MRAMNLFTKLRCGLAVIDKNRYFYIYDNSNKVT